MSNDFIPFAVGGSANVTPQATYSANTTLTQNGFQSGIAKSPDLNKVWRQSSIMAAVLAQFAADYSGNNSVDDGTTATLEANLVAAIRSATKTGVILADTGAANAYTAVNVPPLVSGTWVNGVVQQVKIAHANTGASTYAPDGLTAIPIYGLGLQPLQGGELSLNGTAVLIRTTVPGVNSGNPIAVLMECFGGAQQVAPATQSQHAMQLGQATGRLLRTTVYSRVAGVQNVSVDGGANTTTGAMTFTSLAATNKIRVRAQGGGGGAPGTPSNGASTVAAAAGGGGGSCGESIYLTGFSGGLTVTVGSSGSGGSAGLTTGTAGGTSSLGSLISCPGGGAPGPTPAGTAPLVAGGGIGSASPTGANVASHVGSASGFGLVTAQGALGVGGHGGSAGDGGAGPTGGTNAGGASAINPGAGGAGGSQSAASGGAFAGGSGASGYVIVEEYA